MDTQATNYKDHHDPHNDCPHNHDAEQPCTCKRVLNRKPYRVCKVRDASAPHGIRPQLILSVYPNGMLEIREHGRRMKVQTTLADVYARALMHQARAEMNAKRKAKKLRKAGK